MNHATLDSANGRASLEKLSHAGPTAMNSLPAALPFSIDYSYV
jgi:hypothetical protein